MVDVVLVSVLGVVRHELAFNGFTLAKLLIVLVWVELVVKNELVLECILVVSRRVLAFGHVHVVDLVVVVFWICIRLVEVDMERILAVVWHELAFNGFTLAIFLFDPVWVVLLELLFGLELDGLHVVERDVHR